MIEAGFRKVPTPLEQQDGRPEAPSVSLLLLGPGCGKFSPAGPCDQRGPAVMGDTDRPVLLRMEKRAEASLNPAERHPSDTAKKGRNRKRKRK
jgi:hypothetical protein